MTSHTSSPAQFGYRSSTSRRSFPNLQHASLAPLSSRFPMDEDRIDDDYVPQQILTPSAYVAGRSAPPTPGILSRGQSPSGKEKKKKKEKKHTQFADRFSHESYFPSEPVEGVAKAKSSSALIGLSSDGLGPLSAPPASRKHFKSKSATNTAPANNDEWIHRAGLAIASENRLTKGQSWLSSRASSTSLVLTSTGEEYTHQSQTKVTTFMTGDHAVDGSGSEPPTPRFAGSPAVQSRQHSRANSRTGSRVPSRRGSRVGSRLELTGMTPLDSSKFTAALSRHAEGGSARERGYFDDVDTEVGAGPDFVDPQSDDEEAALGKEEDSEVARLARQRGFGLGGIVDKFVGWTLFNVDEDGDGPGPVAGEDAEDAEAKRKRRRDQLERTASHSLVSTRMGVSKDPPPPPAPEGDKGEGSWQDAAWLLSVASKVLY